MRQDKFILQFGRAVAQTAPAGRKPQRGKQAEAAEGRWGETGRSRNGAEATREK